MGYGWNDFDRSLNMLDEMRRRLDQLWDDIDGGQQTTPMGTSWPRINLFDTGDSLRLVAEVPGVAENEVSLSVQNDLLTLEGERRVRTPEGYTALRQERPSLRFTRSLSMPCRVDADKTQASLKDGVLTVTLPKAPEAKPRQIAVSHE